jgi:N6-L-threonylcarbamoyladenine synthase/protein kinase Bud32
MTKKQKFQGAEATVTIKKEKVEKNRKTKQYRHKELDNRIRQERNKKETRILKKARQNGVNTPKVQETSETKLQMQKIEGKQLKQKADQKPELVEKLANQVARLHSANIIHGDLTTSNAILTPENKIYLIDFGLAFHSERTEDKAVDIHLLKQVFNASHTEKLWPKFKEKYRKEANEKVVEKVSEIEERARYK